MHCTQLELCARCFSTHQLQPQFSTCALTKNKTTAYRVSLYTQIHIFAITLVLLLAGAQFASASFTCPSICICSTLDTKLHANCSALGATALPVFSFELKLHSLRFENNTLPVLGARAFAGLEYLQRLYLSGNGMQQLRADSLYGLAQLHELDLSANLLSTLPAAALKPLASLHTLRLSHNPIVRFDSTELQGLGELHALELAYCELSQLPDLRSLGRLSSLNLTGNQLHSLPEDLFCALDSLRSLNLSSNALLDYRSLGVVDPATGSLCLPQLRALDMSDNRLRELGETSVASLKQLRVLHLRQNLIAHVSELALRSLRNLQSLDLSDNQLATLPNQTFRGSPELRQLRLRNNSLHSLPGELFRELSYLSLLDLANNRLTAEGLSNESFVDLTRLLHLDLSGNSLRWLPKNLFQSLFKVHVLDLSDNQLERLAPHAFTSLYNLHVLRLSGNRLRSLDVHALSGLFVLSQLHLGDNQLTSVDNRALHNSSSLETLSLQNNLLRSLPFALEGVRALKNLDLSGNAIVRLDNDTSPLSKLTQLRSLRLARNQLASLHIHSLRGLISLQTLDLSRNRLQTLDHGVFHDAPSLSSLELQKNSLEDINGQFMKLSSLLHLNVSSNRIKWFDFALIPEQLNSLDLSRNTIPALSNQAPSRQLRLAELRLSHNQLSQLAPALLPDSLRVLDLANNQLDQLQSLTFVHKENLTYVDLRSNRIRSLDMSSVRLPPLALGRTAPQFYLAGNPLLCDCQLEWLQRQAREQLASSSINNPGRQYPHMADLDLLECELPFVKQSAVVPLLHANSSSLLCRYRSHCFALCYCCEFDACDCEMQCPDNCSCYHDSSWQTNIVDCSASGNVHSPALSAVPSRIPMDVTDLYLDGQSLHTLASHTFIGRKNMRALYLNGSAVHLISNRTFNGLALLQTLFLQSNALIKLRGFEFEGLNSLRELRLENNRLEFIADRTFSPLTSLQILRLHNNRLHMLPFASMATQLPALNALQLSGNVFTCDCELLPAMQPLLTRVLDLQQVQCVLHNHRNVSAPGPPLFEFLGSNCAPIDAHLLNFAGHRQEPPMSSARPMDNSNQLQAFSSIGGSSNILPEYLLLLRQSWPLLAALALLGVLLAITLLTGYVYRKQLGVWAYAAFGVRLFQRTGHSRYCMQSERLYDAFVSYAPHEEEFIRHKLAAELELGHPSYRLFLNYRDLPVTNYVKEAVAEVIQCSHRSIILLTPQYLSSENCLFELKMALHSSLHSDHQLILLQMDRAFNVHELYQFDDLHAALKSPNATLIHYEDKRFWERLKYAMPVARSAQHYAYSMPGMAPAYAATLPHHHTLNTAISAASINSQGAPPPPPPPNYCKQKMHASMMNGGTICPGMASHTLRPADIHRASIVDFKRGLPMNV